MTAWVPLRSVDNDLGTSKRGQSLGTGAPVAASADRGGIVHGCISLSLRLLQFSTAPSGVQWADAKVGTGTSFSVGSRVSIDYVMSTTGARYGSKIDSTVARNAPYSRTLGDGSTIDGLRIARRRESMVRAPERFPLFAHPFALLPPLRCSSCPYSTYF